MITIELKILNEHALEIIRSLELMNVLTIVEESTSKESDSDEANDENN